MIVNNMDVAGLIRRIRRFRYETVKAASSSLANLSNADIGRLTSYLSALTTYANWVVSQPELDLPESSPMTYDLGDAESLPVPENESLVDLETMWRLLEIELGNSQSARMPANLISHDERRLREIIAKSESFLADYASQVQPLDLPESAPLRANTGAGRTGI